MRMGALAQADGQHWRLWAWFQRRPGRSFTFRTTLVQQSFQQAGRAKKLIAAGMAIKRQRQPKPYSK